MKEYKLDLMMSTKPEDKELVTKFPNLDKEMKETMLKAYMMRCRFMHTMAWC